MERGKGKRGPNILYIPKVYFKEVSSRHSQPFQFNNAYYYFIQ